LRFLNILLGIYTVIIGYMLVGSLVPKDAVESISQKSKKQLDISSLVAGISALILAGLIGTTILEGNVLNAENFFVPISATGIYLYLRSRNSNKHPFHVLIGLIFGIGIVFKLHPLFDALVVLIAVSLDWLIHNRTKITFATVGKLL